MACHVMAWCRHALEFMNPDEALPHLGSQALELACMAYHVMAWCRHALEIMHHHEGLLCLESQTYDNSKGW